MSRLAKVALAVAILMAPNGALRAEGRHIAVLLDTSRSMTGNDPRRYTAQISKILVDLIGDGDELTVIRMPRGSLLQLFSGGGLGECSAPASSSLAASLLAGQRARFKDQIDALVTYDTGTFFAAPIRTAIEALTLDRNRERMLLIVADSGGLGNCQEPLTRELSRLHDSGAVVAAVNLGGPGAFDGNPAFDLTLGAHDAQGLIEAVAQIYQRFLGSKTVQTGRVDGLVEVEIGPHVADAFLVVAADGPMSSIEQVEGNPGAGDIDADYRGGGTTRGLDGRSRSYRIVHLTAPRPGRWRFRAPDLAATAGWLLLQESSLGVRLVSPGPAPRGVTSPVGIELYDTLTGKRIEAPCDLPGLRLEVEAAGISGRPRDDGTGDDRQAGDCLFTVPATFDDSGTQDVTVHLETSDLDRTFHLQQEVIDVAWRLEPRPPERLRAGEPATLRAAVEPVVPGTQADRPEAVEASADGNVLARLEDDGSTPDDVANDGVYSGDWTPDEAGDVAVEYDAVGGAATQSAEQRLEVRGNLKLEPPPPIRFTPLASGQEGSGRLDLSNSLVLGSFPLRLTTDLKASRSLLEIETEDGWRLLGADPVEVTLKTGGRTSWPLRLRVGSCPEAVSTDSPHDIVIEAAGPDSEGSRVNVPLSVTIEPEPWLRCWWPFLASAIGLVLIGEVIHGFWSPSRFPRRLGIVLSPEADMTEGYFHPIREQRGSGAGFYRDATIHICEDFRLSGKRRGSLATLRANGTRVCITPAPGVTVWRLAADGEWETLPQEESAARFGIVYRNDARSLFFELRNA